MDRACQSGRLESWMREACLTAASATHKSVHHKPARINVCAHKCARAPGISLEPGVVCMRHAAAAYGCGDGTGG